VKVAGSNLRCRGVAQRPAVLCDFVFLIVDPEVPVDVRADAVPFDEVVLLLCGGLVLASCVAVVDDVLAPP
jgi:hypothetical protein